MPFTYFIADLHLSEDRTDITQCLLSFLEHEAPQADALYVLGDLFEVWIGDDNVTPFNTTIANAFKAVSRTTPVYFIHGNRDFAIRDGWAKKAGMTILPEQTVVDLYGKPTLLTHGDELCTRDVNYQKFRKKSRGWWWPRLMLALP
ncbi:UDP-2,3-diacylglucosamine diphosphatase, partial [Alteromonas sp. 14N.309.X.WAT.G.H12]|uniref:UDP-2,3-diacylglucosamine diphosphatase n=1 Tax=Alteromonas sp. 14N.309.X.WAT.G.H12 TaxID=3120824 RepID=UPI002FD6B079